MKAGAQILTGHSRASDAAIAVREFHAAVAQPDTALVVFFCSSDYDLEVLAAQMHEQFADVQVIGVTTAGEIGPAGYVNHSLSGASFSAGQFVAVSGVLEGLQSFSIGQGQQLASDLLGRLEVQGYPPGSSRTFAFLLVDGLSVREEPVVRTIHHALGGLELFGGSAGDDLQFKATYVYFDGRFHRDSAVLTLVATALPFRVFKTQHFTALTERIVVTAADPARRLVHEINGLPAAEEYARIVGVHKDELDPAQFADFPIVVVIDGTDYVRSIQKANPDGSLTMYSAIDDGLVLRVAQGVDIVGNLEATLAGLRAEIGPPQLVIACDCILRNLEISQRGLKDRVSELLVDNNAVGFSTYGEQFGGVHVNQTFTGIAIGSEGGGR